MAQFENKLSPKDSNKKILKVYQPSGFLENSFSLWYTLRDSNPGPID